MMRGPTPFGGQSSRQDIVPPPQPGARPLFSTEIAVVALQHAIQQATVAHKRRQITKEKRPMQVVAPIPTPTTPPAGGQGDSVGGAVGPRVMAGPMCDILGL